MQDMEMEEIEQVDGGVLPVIALAAFDAAIWGYNFYKLKKML